jgi:NDP-sugar pyrophosphorylase family protein
MSRRAVVLAGGKGSRLRPYTLVLPKPLMPIGEYPILEVIVRQLVHFGFGHITLAVNHQADIVKAFFQDGSKWGAAIDYSLESAPLSTIAPLKLIADLPESFLLLNGDVLTDLDFDSFYNNHVSRRNLFTISAATRKHVIDYGVLEIDSAGRLSGFREKPSREYLVSMGIYGVNRRILDLVPSAAKYGFDDLMAGMLAADLPVHVEPYAGEWLDIGRPDDYLQAIETFEQKKGRLLPGCRPDCAASL